MILSGFYVAIHDELKEINCIIFTSFFFLKNHLKSEMEIPAFYAIAKEPIKVQTCSASQNDRLNLSFVKDTNGNVEKMARKGGKTVIYESQILRLTL